MEDWAGGTQKQLSEEYRAMYSWENQYLDLVKYVHDHGDDRVDRTGVGTRADFGHMISINLANGFPAVTTKKLAMKAMVAELIWFLEGSGDERRLCELTHGTRHDEKSTIWTGNATADYWLPKAKFKGDLGRVYGVQWRKWKKYKRDDSKISKDLEPFGMRVYEVVEIDQLSELINKLKTNPTDRRMILSAWNIAEFDEMALPPCHVLSQFFVSKGKLHCLMYQRSVDLMLGLPFNIASYALLTHMLAQVCGLGVGNLKLMLGDVHIYNNHLEGAREQMKRKPLAVPTLQLNPEITDINEFAPSDIHLEGYQSLDAIKLEMAV